MGEEYHGETYPGPEGSGGTGGLDYGGVGRTPPHSLEAERSLLGALLLDPERIPEASETLQADDFYDRRHGLLFDTLCRVVDESIPVDFASVGNALRAQQRFEEVGGNGFLIGLAQSVSSSAHLTYHVKIVSETAVLRGLIRESTELLTQAYATVPDGNAVQDLLDDGEHRIFQLSRDSRAAGAEGIGDVLEEVFQRIDARSHRQGLTGIPLGFGDLDDQLSGLNAGDFIVLAARPSMGKTAFALNIVENAVMSTPEFLGRRPGVLLFSLEMGRMSLIERMLCSRGRVEGHRLRTGKLTGEERSDMIDAADELRTAKLYIDDTPGISMMSLRSRARRLRAKGECDLIVVDYLQLLSYPRSESRQQEISNISRSLKGLARELEVPVIALAQLSRAVESRDPPRPQLADLRESGSIEQDADVVMLLYRPEYYAKYDTEENKNLAEVIVAKHRNGPTGSVKLNFRREIMRFEVREWQNSEAIHPQG